jgi:hypothetical protein
VFQLIDYSKLRYNRGGGCKRCGKCCLNEDCEHLQFEEDGTATCLIFGKPERPKRCILFPQLPPIIIEGCGYYFIDKWEKNHRLGYMEV